jgi:uncharacterized membrane protein
MIDKKKILSIITDRKCLIIATAVLVAIGLGIVGIVIFQNAREISSANELATLTGAQYNLIRLEIFRLCIAMFLIAAAGAVGIMLVLKIKLEYIYIVAALCLGTTYMVSITPFSVPDEPHHYQASYMISGHILFDKDPFMVDSRHFIYCATYGHQNVPDDYLRLMDEGIYILRGEAELMSLYEPNNTHYPIYYFPQALGISIARIIGLSFFGLFYMGRFFNLAFYLLCVTFSLKRLKAFRLPIFLIGLMPMTMHQAASFSYDNFINAISILFIAYAISCIYERESFQWRDYFVLMVTSVLLAPTKMVYLPIALLVFIVAWRWKDTVKKKAWILAASIFAASAIAAAAAFMIIFYAGMSDLAGDQLNWEGRPNYTMSFVFANPIETLKIFIRTLQHFYESYFYGLFGQYLSGLTMDLPRWYMNIIILLIFAGLLYGKKDEWQPSKLERLIYFTICGMVVFLSLMAMFLTWTSQGLPVVYGVAGRYFIPILPLALLMLRFKKILIPYKAFRNSVICAFLVMQGAVILYILDFTIGQYG